MNCCVVDFTEPSSTLWCSVLSLRHFFAPLFLSVLFVAFPFVVRFTVCIHYCCSSPLFTNPPFLTPSFSYLLFVSSPLFPSRFKVTDVGFTLRLILPELRCIHLLFLAPIPPPLPHTSASVPPLFSFRIARLLLLFLPCWAFVLLWPVLVVMAVVVVVVVSC